MTEVTTSFEKFTQASQSGSGASWSNVNGLEQGNSGTASVLINSGNSNTLKFQIPDEIEDIPDGASFVSMRFRFDGEQAGPVGNDTSEFRVTLNRGTAGGLLYPMSGNGATVNAVTTDGDLTYWGLNTTYTPTGAISALKTGDLAYELQARNTGGFAFDKTMSVEDVKLQVTYTVPIGRGGAIIAAAL